MEFVNRLLGEILPPRDVDSLKLAALAPAPRRARCHADLAQPIGKAANRRTTRNNIMSKRHAAILQIWRRLGVDSLRGGSCPIIAFYVDAHAYPEHSLRVCSIFEAVNHRL